MKESPERLLNWVNHWVETEKNLDPQTIKLFPLTGDGSQRRFFRLFLSQHTRIVMYDPEGLTLNDYVSHQSFLKQRQQSVPEFYKIDTDAGVIVMEDLGDTMLQDQIRSDRSRKMPFLYTAVRALAEWHGETYPVPAEIPAGKRSFDAEKYYQELLFTLEHLHQRLLGFEAPNPSELEGLKNFCEQLSLIRPKVLCHRDFHTRNLMLKEERLYFIDFQDARLGPPHYDLASLLYDSYIQLTNAERAELLHEYKKGLSEKSVSSHTDWSRFEENLAQVAFQRTVKAAGSFASFYTRYEKKTHLDYLLPSLAYAQTLIPSVQKIYPEIETLFPIEEWKERFSSLRSRFE